MENTGIYMWTNIHTGLKYIGQAKNLRIRRNRFQNFNNTNYAGDYINNARIKYNDLSHWKYEILEYCTIDELDEKESYWITEKNTIRPNGYNLTEGGEGTKGHIVSEEQRKRLIGNTYGLGYHHTEETKKHLSEIKLGAKNHNYGKVYTEEERNNRSKNNPKSKKVYQYSEDGKTLIKVFNSVRQAAKEVGTTHSNIIRVCDGLRIHHKGFIWSYKIL